MGWSGQSGRFVGLSTSLVAQRLLCLLASTLFQSAKLPLNTWLLVMYFLYQTKNGISALDLGRRLCVDGNNV